MSRIRLLSEHLANQIAAGEVVERPASVVKELLENSLDAGATRIFIQIEGNGTRLIRIRDNGDGMDGDDVLLSIERHATSKLQSEDQLKSIGTLGFRGEALPSIGSVSNLIILSRFKGNPTGTKADIRFGRLHGIHEDGCPQGTIIEVRNLFGNVPARKKFLKSARTELFHIEETVRNLALAYPEIEFSLQEDNRTTLHLMPGDQAQRVRDIFQYRKKLLILSRKTEQPFPMKTEGYLLLPDSLSSSRTSRLRTLVNHRAIQDAMIRRAVSEGLHGFFMKGQQPAGALLLDIEPEQIDVNVHPAKREIRFRDSNPVFRFLQQATMEAVQGHQETIRSDLFSSRSAMEQEPVREEVKTTGTIERERPPEQPVLPVRPKIPLDPAPEKEAPETPIPRFQPSLVSREPEPTPEIERRPQPSSSPSPEKKVQPPPVQPSPPPKQTDPVPEPRPTSVREPGGMQLIGSLFNLYLLYQKEDQLIVIDQHAAHERILYQQLLQGYLNRNMPSQSLLFPSSVELLPAQADLMEQNPDELVGLGLRAEHFGEATWIIKAVPAMLSHLNPKDILFDILNSLESGRRKENTGVVPRFIDAILSSMACKAAVKAGSALKPQEMTALLEQMQDSEFFSHCPHGRPVYKIFSKNEIEKWFHRQ